MEYTTRYILHYLLIGIGLLVLLPGFAGAETALETACRNGSDPACMQITYGGGGMLPSNGIAGAGIQATAQPAMSGAANAMCEPWKVTRCGCGNVEVPAGGLFGGTKCVHNGNTYDCPVGICRDKIPGFKDEVLGICVKEHVCEAKIAPGLNGGNVLDQGLSQLGKMLGQVLQQLMQGGGGGGEGAGTSPIPGTCPNGYYQVSTPSSDPCAQYVPPTSSQIDTSLPGSSAADTLMQALTGSPSDGTSGGASVTITNTNTNTNTNSNTTVSVISPTSTAASAFNIGGTGVPVSLVPLNGSMGDIQLTGTGATVLAGATDAQSNTTVAGFYGSDTFGGQEPQGIAASLCHSRPWASNFLSVVIPPTFFDGLCTWRGYQVGAPPAPAPVLQQTAITPRQPTTPQPSATTTPAAPPRVDIWAAPASVPLATRTSIFWNTQGVSDCTVSSPEGNFNQTSLSGGAATVPITGATTFTILCAAPDGSSVTDSVTVNLSI